MKIKYNWNEYNNFINNSICLKKINWNIINIGCITVMMYLKGKEFYIHKFETTKLKNKNEVYYFKTKIQAQTYIRGLRRNIKKYYKNFEIKEEFIYSEEGEI